MSKRNNRNQQRNNKPAQKPADQLQLNNSPAAPEMKVEDPAVTTTEDTVIQLPSNDVETQQSTAQNVSAGATEEANTVGSGHESPTEEDTLDNVSTDVEKADLFPNRKGYVIITKEILDDEAGQFEKFSEAMSKHFNLISHEKLESGNMRALLTSELFDEVAEGDTVPVYNFLVLPDGTVKVSQVTYDTPKKKEGPLSFSDMLKKRHQERKDKMIALQAKTLEDGKAKG